MDGRNAAFSLTLPQSQSWWGLFPASEVAIVAVSTYDCTWEGRKHWGDHSKPLHNRTNPLMTAESMWLNYLPGVHILTMSHWVSVGEMFTFLSTCSSDLRVLGRCSHPCPHAVPTCECWRDVHIPVHRQRLLSSPTVLNRILWTPAFSVSSPSQSCSNGNSALTQAQSFSSMASQ